MTDTTEYDTLVVHKDEETSTCTIFLNMKRFDLDSCSDFTHLTSFLSDFDNFVVDFREVEYMDSTGVGQLILLKRRLEDVDNHNIIHLINVEKGVFNILKTVNLTRFFNIN